MDRIRWIRHKYWNRVAYQFEDTEAYWYENNQYTRVPPELLEPFAATWEVIWGGW